MKEITVTNQKELDAIKGDFKEFTYIYIKSSEKIYITTKWENSIVEARGNSRVVAWENSSVEARGNSSVVAWENSSVSGFEFSFLIILSTSVIVKKLYQYAIVRLKSKIKLPKKPKTVTIIDHSKVELKYDKTTFVEYCDLEKTSKNKVILYKSVNPKTLRDFRTNSIKYEGIVECPDFDPSKERECGGGLHLCAKPLQALSFNQGQLLKCEVDLKDIVVYSKNIEKVRCKKVKVLGKCDKKGNLL
jgi:hypothetical protein